MNQRFPDKVKLFDLTTGDYWGVGLCFFSRFISYNIIPVSSYYPPWSTPFTWTNQAVSCHSLCSSHTHFVLFFTWSVIYPTYLSKCSLASSGKSSVTPPVWFNIPLLCPSHRVQSLSELLTHNSVALFPLWYMLLKVWLCLAWFCIFKIL